MKIHPRASSLPDLAKKKPRGPGLRHVLVGGRLVNLAGGDGHPVEIMDLTLAVQALAAHHLAKNASGIPAGLQPIPAEIDRLVASTSWK